MWDALETDRVGLTQHLNAEVWPVLMTLDAYVGDTVAASNAGNVDQTVVALDAVAPAAAQFVALAHETVRWGYNWVWHNLDEWPLLVQMLREAARVSNLWVQVQRDTLAALSADSGASEAGHWIDIMLDGVEAAAWEWADLADRLAGLAAVSR